MLSMYVRQLNHKKVQCIMDKYANNLDKTFKGQLNIIEHNINSSSPQSIYIIIEKPTNLR